MDRDKGGGGGLKKGYNTGSDSDLSTHSRTHRGSVSSSAGLGQGTGSATSGGGGGGGGSGIGSRNHSVRHSQKTRDAILNGLNSMQSDDESSHVHVPNVMDVLIKEGKAKQQQQQQQQQQRTSGYNSVDDSMNNSIGSSSVSKRGGGGGSGGGNGGGGGGGSGSGNAGGDVMAMGHVHRKSSNHSQLSSVKENIVSVGGDCGDSLGCISADSLGDTDSARRRSNKGRNTPSPAGDRENDGVAALMMPYKKTLSDSENTHATTSSRSIKKYNQNDLPDITQEHDDNDLPDMATNSSWK